MKNVAQPPYFNGFREPSDEFFEYVMEVGRSRQQPTPFIVVSDEEVKAIYFTHELIMSYSRETMVMMTWHGKWRSDVFAFEIGELLEYIHRQQELGVNPWKI